MNHDGDKNIYLWNVYANASPENQAEMLRKLETELPHMTVQQQVNAFIGAPEDMIVKFFQGLAWESQVAIWKRVMPVSARPQARPLLAHEAEVALKLYKHYCL